MKILEFAGRYSFSLSIDLTPSQGIPLYIIL